MVIDRPKFHYVWLKINLKVGVVLIILYIYYSSQNERNFFFKTVALGTKIAFSRLYLACATIFDRFEIILIYSEML